MTQAFDKLKKSIISCEKCPRLRRHCEAIAREKKKAYLDEEYWGKPIPGFGDAKARLVIVGLAPAAHGANRTGRIFTGDRSGEWLYRALHDAGFANQAESTGRDDGLKLNEAWVTCGVRCAPPENKPTPKEFENCRPFLHAELDLLIHARVYLALGSLALKSIETYLKERGDFSHPLKFAHGASVKLPSGRLLLCSFHPSQQNTFTGRLTRPMFDSIFSEAARFLI